MEEFAESWELDRRFEPKMPDEDRARKIEGWREAVRRTLTQR